MIELRLLGPHALLDTDGREITSLPAQPKRFSLLAFLAIGGAGYHRRDTLAAMFWPEMDQMAARRALRNTLYHLREALGDRVIVTQGDEAVAIDPTRLTCDVTRLAEAVAATRYEEAVESYRGELLAGAHVPNAGEAFEEWLSQERRRVADLRMRAVTALVDREQQAGNLLGAARWAERACDMAAGDEGWLRRAMKLLDDGGDTGGALRLYEATTRRLATEFGATPSGETTALAARIRDGHAKPPGRPPAGTAMEAAPAVSDPPASRPHASRARGRVLYLASALAAAVVLVLVVRAAGAKRHRTPTPPRVLVTVFDNRTGDSTLQPLGRMAQDWLAQGLVRTRLVDVVDPQAVLVQGRMVGGSPPDPVAVARRTGAGLVVSGTYYRTGDTLFLQSAVTDVGTGRILRVVGPILSSAHTPVSGLNELQSRVMTALASAVDVRGAESVSGGDIPPFDAYRDYMDGQDAYSHGDSPRAKALYLRAARRDTAFTGALIAATYVAADSKDCGLVDSVAKVLGSRSPPLSRWDQMSLQISDARCRGRNEEMSRLTLEQADLEPHNAGAQMPAAAAASWANRPKRQLEVLERVNPETDLGWSTDTTHSNYWGSVSAALHMLGRYQEELSVTDRLLPGAPLTRVWERGSALAALGRPTAVLALLDSSLTLPVETQSDLGLAPYTDGRPEYVVTPGWVANWVSRELAYHGDGIAARQAAERAVAWYRGRPARERETIEERFTATCSLEMLGQYSEAEGMARQLVAEDSTNVDFRGELAGLEAERGEAALADSLDRWLAAQSPARVNWSASVYRARVAALLGRPDSAMARLREAFDEGIWPDWLHQEPAFVRLRKRADYMALTSPKG